MLFLNYCYTKLIDYGNSYIYAHFKESASLFRPASFLALYHSHFQIVQTLLHLYVAHRSRRSLVLRGVSLQTPISHLHSPWILSSFIYHSTCLVFPFRCSRKKVWCASTHIPPTVAIALLSKKPMTAPVFLGTAWQFAVPCFCAETIRRTSVTSRFVYLPIASRPLSSGYFATILTFILFRLVSKADRCDAD